MTVITLFPGHAPEEVEKQVTIPLEIGLSGLPHCGAHVLAHAVRPVVPDPDLRRPGRTTTSRASRCSSGCSGVDLPPDVQPQLAPLSTPIGELYRYRLARRRRHARPSCARIQDWMVERQLRLAPGVADVVSFGGFIKQYQVNLDLAQLKSLRRLDAAGVHRARPRQRQRRRQLHRAGRAAVL